MPGFTDDIGARPEDFNLAVSLFFVTFVLFQPLSAAVGWWLGPWHWIPVIMVSCLHGCHRCCQSSLMGV